MQRVREASVSVDGHVVSRIGTGLAVLVGIAVEDTSDDGEWLARKITDLRIFDDESGAMNRSVRDTGGELLAVSQFTLYASMRSGNRPSWSRAARFDIAKPRFDAFVDALATRIGKPVATGTFGAHMAVELVNDGPVTLWLDSRVRD